MKRLFLDFDQEVAQYQLLREIRIQDTFLGPWWEFRSMLGSEAVLFRNRFAPQTFELSDQELLEFVARKDVFARIENFTILNEAVKYRLISMRAHSEQILAALKALE